MTRSLFGICSPIQLLAAVCLRIRECSYGCPNKADLIIAPKFSGAPELLQDNNLKQLFDRIALYDPFEGNYFPQVKDYIDYKKSPCKHQAQFMEEWPLGECSYTAFYCGDPHMVVRPRLYLSEQNAETYLFDEGIGTYTGKAASFFCINNKTSLLECKKIGQRAFAKEVIKRLAMILAKDDKYFISPSKMMVFNASCYKSGTFGEDSKPIEIPVPTPFDLRHACRYFDQNNDKLSDAGLVYLGTWFDTVSEADQRLVIETIADSCNRSIIVRAHPRFPFTLPISKEGVIFDSPDSSWEMYCLDRVVNGNSILFGYCSTAQTTPKFLTGEEPVIVLLDAVFHGSKEIPTNAVVFGNLLRGFYNDPSKIIIPSNINELKEILIKINKKVDA